MATTMAAAPAPPPPPQQQETLEEGLARGQWELLLPDAVLVQVFTWLTPGEVARAGTACHRWREAAANEALWRGFSKALFTQFHPDPAKVAAAATRHDGGGGGPPASDGWGAPPVAYLLATGQISEDEAEARLARQELVRREAAAAAAAARGGRPARRRAGSVTDGGGAGLTLQPPAAAAAAATGDGGDDTPSTPAPPAAAPTIDDRIRELEAAAAGRDVDLDGVLIAVERERRREAARAAREAEAARLAAAVEARAGVLRDFKRAVSGAGGSFRRAFHAIPAVRIGRGVYALRHTYVRTPVRDMFHAVEAGTLTCVYHRTVAFRADGSLLYAMLPGEVTEALKEFRSMLNATPGSGGGGSGGASATAATTAAGGGGAAPARTATTAAPPQLPSQSQQHGYTAHGINTLKVGTGRSVHVGVGYWWLEGRTLRAEVATGGSIVTRWTCHVPAPDELAAAGHRHALPNGVLHVTAMTLTERGGHPDDATRMAALEGEEFRWHAVPWMPE